jgi:hypothetical protein
MNRGHDVWGRLGHIGESLPHFIASSGEHVDADEWKSKWSKGERNYNECDWMPRYIIRCVP